MCYLLYILTNDSLKSAKMEQLLQNVHAQHKNKKKNFFLTSWEYCQKDEQIND